jgi:hypothetical protein
MKSSGLVTDVRAHGKKAEIKGISGIWLWRGQAVATRFSSSGQGRGPNE